MISLKEKNNPEADSFKEKLKESWKWLWNSESIWSYVVFLAILFVLVKFIFLPGLGLIFHAPLPLAIVESSSMEHYSLKYCQAINSKGACIKYSTNYEMCGNEFQEKKFFDKEEYWNSCGKWYEQNTNITKEQFQSFSFKNGFRKGDIMIIWGWKTPKLGDVIVFDAGRNHPIIHRIIEIDETTMQTKGDHNSAQLTSTNNAYKTDETNIQESQLQGVAIARIPYAGWVKLFFVELLQKLV